MPLISVVVPVYKVKDYLERCLDSILSQSFTSFDLIIIDDGSPDECGEICDKYAARDDRVIVIHQANQGQAEARNVGIEWAIKNSDSEWITFIDSDDWIHEDYLKLLYESAKEYNVDLSICNCIKTHESVVNKFKPKKESIIFTPEDFWSFSQYGGPWAKLYRKDFFHTIKFPKGIIYEDVFVVYRLIFMANRLVYLEDPLYYYYIRENSTVNSTWTPRVLMQIVGRKEQLKYFKKNNYPNAFAASARNMLYEIKKQYEDVIPLKSKYSKEFFKLKVWYKYYLIIYHRCVPIKSNTNLYRVGLPLYTVIYKKYTYLLERRKVK